MSTSQAQLNALFDSAGFLLLHGLDSAEGAEFGVDASPVWTVKKGGFEGIKFLPPGFHLFLYTPSPLPFTAAPSSSSSITELDSSSLDRANALPGIRRGILRFTAPGEVLIRHLDAAGDAVSQPGATSSRDVSRDQLRSIDAKLAPYPYAGQKTWADLTSLITQATLDRVFKETKDAQGDHVADGLMEASGNPSATAGRAGAGDEQGSERRQWGKPRDNFEVHTSHQAASAGDGSMAVEPSSNPAEPAATQREKQLHFAKYDLKRSWAAGATGEEITRDARDKSWLLGHVVQTQLGGQASELLAELQLAFVLFTQLQNFSALEVYKRHLTLLARSHSVLLAEAEAGEMYLSLLERVLIPHFSYLRPEFFAEDLPDGSLEAFLLTELSEHLRRGLRGLLRPARQAEVNIPLVEQAWKRLSDLVEKKFGWTSLGSLKREGGWEATAREMREKGRTRVSYNLLRDPRDSDSEDGDGAGYEEDGEDAPVVVEL